MGEGQDLEDEGWRNSTENEGDVEDWEYARIVAGGACTGRLGDCCTRLVAGDGVCVWITYG